MGGGGEEGEKGASRPPNKQSPRRQLELRSMCSYHDQVSGQARGTHQPPTTPDGARRNNRPDGKEPQQQGRPGQSTATAYDAMRLLTLQHRFCLLVMSWCPLLLARVCRIAGSVCAAFRPPEEVL
ncbi:hypothetical protein NDU88_006390 [Pleurodeles waltl]|uniref:Uncharacterized protein n=1 Tax=Pleurodeles waltl TaxID=8319 RepID=A0AAV7LNY9_PLEWA|nr:hypothetical protein NDU88_006390 [Pleurodeles waltl]